MKSRPQSRHCNVLSEKLTVWPPLASRSEARTKLTGLPPLALRGDFNAPAESSEPRPCSGWHVFALLGYLVLRHGFGEPGAGGGAGARRLLQEGGRDQPPDQGPTRGEGRGAGGVGARRKACGRDGPAARGP